MDAIKPPKIRESNIELCRIICMMMIITHHLVLHGGLLSTEGMYTNKMIGNLLYPGGKVGFDAFIAISAWFLAGSDFKAERFVKTYLQVIFYSIITTIAAAALGVGFSAFQIFGALLPLTGAVQGYAATYLAFYLLMPFLSMVTRRINDKQNLLLITILSVFVIGSRIIGPIATTEQFCYSRVTLFVYFYFLMVYIRKHPAKQLDNTALMLIVFVLSWGVILLYNMCSIIWPQGIPAFISYTISVVADEGGLLYMICGLSLFFFFKSIRIKPNKAINLLGSTTLAVLLIHDGHFFRGMTWTLLKTSEWYYSRYFILRTAACVAGIYLCCSAIELLRRNLIEKPLFRSAWIKQLCASFDKIALQPHDDTTQQYEGSSCDAGLYEDRIAELTRELDRKDKALAEIAARYALKED